MKPANTDSISLLLATAAIVLLNVSGLHAREELAEGEHPPIPATIDDGKLSEFGFISHTIDCPKYFDRFGKGRTETIEVLLPDKMEPGKRYRVLYALAPLTSAGVVDHYKMGERYWVGPLLDIREQGLHNKYQVICIKVMAINRHKDWRGYLQEVVVPYVDRTYPTIAEAKGRALVGFSKTGDDVWKLLLANPEIYGKACGWDCLPKPEWVIPHAELLRGKPPRLILTGGSGATKDDLEPKAAIHRKLTEEKIPHLYHLKLRDKHIWSSGWIGDAMRLLFQDSKDAHAAEKSWEDETVLVSQEGAESVVRALKGKKVLLKNADPQLAIEWAMANVRTTVVTAGKYVLADTIDIPRDDVTLIVDRGAELSLNRANEDKATTLPLMDRGRLIPTSHLWPSIVNRGHDNFRMLLFGTLTRRSPVPGKSGEAEKGRTKDPYGIMFDGKKDDGSCGIKGGMLVQTGPIDQCIWLVDCSKVQLPLAVQNWSSAGVLSMEGCEDCSLGLIANLAAEPGGGTGEVADLNGRNKGITIERLIGERSGEELLDCNASEATVGEIVAIGTYNKIATLSQGCGRRFTTRPRPPKIACDVKQETKLADYASVTLKNEVPKMPDALPCFTVKSTVEVTMKDGSKKTYTRKATIDVRSGGFKPEKKE